MRNITISIATVLVLLIPAMSYAWVSSTDATIVGIIMHEEGISRDETIIKFSGEGQAFNCYIKNTEKNLTSLVLSLYMAGKRVTVHCYDESRTTLGSFSSHKLHRLISN